MEFQNIRVTVLGWQGPVPGAMGACSGYLVEEASGKAIVLDLGSGSLARLLQYKNPCDLSAIILTHLHWDHISDMLPLSYLQGVHVVPVFSQTEPLLQRQVLECAGWQLRNHEDCRIGPFKLSFLRARHPVPASCVKIECGGRTVVYTGDTNTMEGLEPFVQGADLLIADAGLCESEWTEQKPHLSPRLCAQLAKDAGVQRLVLTHLSAKHAPETILGEASAIFPEAVLAREGLRISI